MSPTSTSDPAHEEALQRIIAYFILRRGRGSAISSRDADALDTWARKGHTWMDILHAIDRAFAKSRNVPQSLRACGAYLVKTDLSTHTESEEDLLDPNILAEAFGKAPVTPPPSKPKPTSAEPQHSSTVLAALKHLTQEADRSDDRRAQSAYLLLFEEIQERMHAGPIPPETVAVFDEALALIGLEQLGHEQRRQIEARLDSAPPPKRSRLLLEEVGEALALHYPLAGCVRRGVAL